MASKYDSAADKLEVVQAEEQRRAVDANDEGGQGAAGGVPGVSVGMFSKVNEKTDGMLVTDEHCVIKFANKVLLKMFGFKQVEIVGRNVSSLMPEPYSSQHDSYVRQYLTTGKSRVLGTVRAFEALHRDGHTFQISLAVNKVNGNEGQQYVAVIKRLSEEELATCVIDRNSSIQSFNKVFLQMFGFKSAEEVSKKHVRLIMPPHIAKNHDEFVRNYYEHGVKHVIGVAGRRLVGRRKDGSEFPLTIQLEEIGDGDNKLVLGRMKEISSGLGVVTINTKGVMQSVNQHVADLFGYKQSELVGFNVSVLMPPPYDTFHDQYIDRYLTSRKPTILGAMRVVQGRHRDGSTFPLKLEVTAHKDGAGEELFHAKLLSYRDQDHADAENQIQILLDDAALVVDFGARGHELFGGLQEGQSLSDALNETLPSLDYLLTFNHNGVHVTITAEASAGATAVRAVLLVRRQTVADIPAVSFAATLIPLAELEGLVGVDDGAVIKFASPGLGLLFGYAPADLVGQNVSVLMPDPIALKHDGYMSNFKSARRSKVVNKRFATVGQHRDRTAFGIVLEVAQPNKQRLAVAEDPSVKFTARIVFNTGLIAGIANVAQPEDNPNELKILQRTLSVAGRASAGRRRSTMRLSAAQLAPPPSPGAKGPAPLSDLVVHKSDSTEPPPPQFAVVVEGGGGGDGKPRCEGGGREGGGRRHGAGGRHRRDDGDGGRGGGRCGGRFDGARERRVVGRGGGRRNGRERAIKGGG